MTLDSEDTGKMPVLQAFDPEAEFEVRQRNLPHWRQEGGTYFVTFRLADSLPRAKLESLRAQRREWLRKHPPPVSPADLRRFQVLFSARIEQYLAAGYGACWLRRPEVADLLEGALRHFDSVRYQLGAYVIMPNHVHLLITPTKGHDLSDILHSWKSYSANRINRAVGRRGTLWQEESFDHLLRSEEELEHYRRYVAENPEKAGLANTDYRLGNL